MLKVGGIDFLMYRQVSLMNYTGIYMTEREKNNKLELNTHK